MAFTNQEKAEIKHFLSYPDWSQMAASIQLGFPAGSQPLFLVEQAFTKLTAEGEAQVRFDLCQCKQCEAQIADARSRMKAVQLGDLRMNPNEANQLRGELQYWCLRLADDLGVVKDPYSQMAYQGMAGGRNARVVS